MNLKSNKKNYLLSAIFINASLVILPIFSDLKAGHLRKSESFAYGCGETSLRADWPDCKDETQRKLQYQDKEHQAIKYKEEAQVFKGNKQYEQAIESINKGIELKKITQIKNIDGIEIFYLLRARMRVEVGEYENAIKDYKLSEKYFKASSGKDYIWMDKEIGWIKFLQKDFKGALKYADIYLKNIKRKTYKQGTDDYNKQLYSLAGAYYWRAKYALAARDLTSACKDLEESLSYEEKHIKDSKINNFYVRNPFFSNSENFKDLCSKQRNN